MKYIKTWIDYRGGGYYTCYKVFIFTLMIWHKAPCDFCNHEKYLKFMRKAKCLW